MNFNTIKLPELSEGKHKSFDEGTCFMELVAFMAGESHSDHPSCSCPVLTRYGITLNDRMPHGVRNELLRPIVPQMLDTRSLKDEQRRAEYIIRQTFIRILPKILPEPHATACKKAGEIGSLEDMRKAARAADAAARAADAAAAARNAARAAADAADAAADAAAYAAYAAADIWQIACDILKEAINLVPRPQPVIKKERLKAVQEYA